jgi:hypothetical protein
MASVTLELATVSDWESFHDQCMEVFGFPSFYGRNMDAWANCLSGLTKGDNKCRFSLDSREYLIIHLAGFESFLNRAPEISMALVRASLDVNRRYLAEGEMPRIALVPE